MTSVTPSTQSNLPNPDFGYYHRNRDKNLISYTIYNLLQLNYAQIQTKLHMYTQQVNTTVAHGNKFTRYLNWNPNLLHLSQNIDLLVRPSDFEHVTKLALYA